MDTVRAIQNELDQFRDPEKAAFLPKFFQAFPGGYGEGDLFLGVTVPNQRKVAGKYYRLVSLEELRKLLKSKYHEHRLTALFILVQNYDKAKSEPERKKLVDFYLSNLASVNSWDLVDSSAYKILGPYLQDKDKSILVDLAADDNLWKQRVAIIATFHFIKQGDFAPTLKLADMLLDHEHDLIHKAVGWMLREVGKRNFEKEYHYLLQRYKEMPRTMLRYAIEKFDPALRKKFLAGEL